jgi:Methyltransferase domain
MNGKRGWPDGHYYSPIPGTEDIARALAWSSSLNAASVPGIELDMGAMWARAAELARAVGAFRLRQHPDGARLYGWDNGQFNAADAGVLTGVLACARPRRVVEVGGGFSTACILDACKAFRLATRLTTIDPFPARLLEQIGTAPRCELNVLVSPVQDVGLGPFLELGPGDVLFIDSSHVAKAGSDVLFEFFEVLPRLAPGVLVHVHDAFPGFEYPREWLEAGRYWTELYLLRAFLIGNRGCRVDFWPGLLATMDKPRLDALLPIANGAVGGSLWLRVVSRPTNPDGIL